jgi:hypothetical protein
MLIERLRDHAKGIRIPVYPPRVRRHECENCSVLIPLDETYCEHCQTEEYTCARCDDVVDSIDQNGHCWPCNDLLSRPRCLGCNTRMAHRIGGYACRAPGCAQAHQARRSRCSTCFDSFVHLRPATERGDWPDNCPDCTRRQTTPTQDADIPF